MLWLDGQERDVLLLRDAEGGNGGGEGTGDQNPAPVDFATWQGSWTAEQKAAFEGHEAGLKSALAKERTEKGDLEKQLRTLSKQAGDDSALQQQLDTMADALKLANEQVDFINDAVKMGCTQPKLALLAAREDGLISKTGKVDWDGLKNSYGSLFRDGEEIPDAGAGEGDDGLPNTKTMDDFLRGL